MNLWFRLLSWLLSRAWRRPLGPLDASRLRFTVLPTDLDVNLHMNNGRYLALMDLGRLDLLARCGLARVAIKKGWRPIAAAVTIRYFQSLTPFQRFTLESRVVGWDEKWFFFEQTFVCDSRLMARAYFKGLLIGPRGRIPSSEVLTLAGFSPTAPELSAELRSRLDSLG